MATAHDKKRATAIISILLISSALVAGVSIALAERRNNYNAQGIISSGEEKTTSQMFGRILGAKQNLPFLKRRKKESPSLKERGLFDVIEDDQMGAPKIVRLEEEEQQEEESL